VSVITAVYTFTGQGEDFGPRADGLFIPHTAENGAANLSLVSARNLAIWQDRDDTLGSYNLLGCVDGVMQTVPVDHASGGVNPSSSFWNPEPWLYQVLDASEVDNPNFFGLNYCFLGNRVDHDRNGWPTRMIQDCARAIVEEEARIGRRVVVADHETFQDNRTDVGPTAMRLIATAYYALTGRTLIYEGNPVMPGGTLPDTALPEEDDMYEWVLLVQGTPYVALTIPAGADTRREPSHTGLAAWTFARETRLKVVGRIESPELGLWWVVQRLDGVDSLFLVANSRVKPGSLETVPAVNCSVEVAEAIASTRASARIVFG